MKHPCGEKPFEKDDSNPFYRYDPDQYIPCGRCASGTLDLLRGALGAGAEIVKRGASLAAQLETVCALRNLLIMGNLLGNINSGTLHRIAEGLPAATQQVPADKHRRCFGFSAE